MRLPGLHTALSVIALGCILALAGEPRLPARPPFLRLAFLGDVMLGRGVAQAHAAGGWDNALAYLAPQLRQADFSLATLASPLTGRPLVRPAYDLRGPSGAAFALSAAGLRAVGLANNHSLDSGPGGVEDTRQALATAGIRSIGPAMQAVSFDLSGYRLAVIALDDVSAPVDPAAASAAVRQAALQSDLVIALVHWGMEYQAGPTPSQQALASALARAGAGLIIGAHPHVLQPIVWLPRPGRSGRALVAYSLGNALFDQPTPPDAARGAMLLVEWSPSGIRAVQAVPFHVDALAGQVEAPSPEEAQQIQQRLSP